MPVSFQVWDASTSAWLDKTDKLRYVKRKITSRQLEALDGELLNDSVKAGDAVRLLNEASVVVFEGVVHESRRRHGSGDIPRCEFTAYTDLVKYERHVVFRSYATGTKAGTIIKDLASLETGVDVTNVDELSTPSLNQNWDIENYPALDVMLNVAKGTNYYLRMKPAKKLFFKPKQVGTYAAVINVSNTISAEYSEDRWKLKNRVIYVGQNGQVLADVSEPPGDMPEVVHDPFLTDSSEALRRAQTRLQMNKEYGRQLRIEMAKTDFEALGVDLFDTVRVNLPSLGLSNIDMYIVEIEHDVEARRYLLTLGGRLELFEDFLQEALGGDAAALFGASPLQTEEAVAGTSALINALTAAAKIQATGRTVRIVNKPPIVFDSGANVTLDDDGNLRLAAGYTSGWIEWGFNPQSETFSRWLRVHYRYDAGDGSVTVSLKRGTETIENNIPEDYDIPYLPTVLGMVTENSAADWGVSGGTVADSDMAIIGWRSLKISRTGSSVEAYYPAARNLGWDIGFAKTFRVYLYSPVDGNIEVRLHTDVSNYRKVVFPVVAGVWKRYEAVVSTMNMVGSPTDTVNWISFLSTVSSFNIDSDYLFLPAGREKLTLRAELLRPSASSVSPKITLMKLVWREGKG